MLGCLLIAGISGFPNLSPLLKLSSSLLLFHPRPVLTSKATRRRVAQFSWELQSENGSSMVLYLLSMSGSNAELTDECLIDLMIACVQF